ncbi:MAG: carboxylate--amine ligase [Elusimicrobiota bacterium]|nr:carboxylate--amine ligase [Elusimicrobiota bacterium]
MNNFIMLSPQYPPRLRFFANRLKARGFNVLGIGDADWGNLDEALRADLSEYCRADLSCYSGNEELVCDKYSSILSAVRHLADKHGPASCLESFNEWWLPLDAALRQDLGIPGLKPADLPRLIRKSVMKERFRQAGVAVVEGEIVTGLSALLDFFERSGRDIVAKPDRGVGASDTRRIRSREEAERFFNGRNPAFPYYIEKFICGPGRELYSFDGFTDAAGEPVFFTCHHYIDGILEVVEGNPLSYHNLRRDEIPADLKAAGLAALRAFDLKKNFFHIEFFRLNGACFGLEINARPPGVLTVDMINHSKGVDCWDLYARMCAGEKLDVRLPRDLVCCYAARVFDRPYLLSHEDLLSRYGGEIVFHMPMDSKVMGDYAYLVLTETQERRQEILERISALRG